MTQRRRDAADPPPPCRCCGKSPARPLAFLPGKAVFCSSHCAGSYGMAAALLSGPEYCPTHRAWHRGVCPACAALHAKEDR